MDCGARLEWSGINRPPERCDPCRIVRIREKNRERSIAWVTANPELARERWRLGYQRNAERIRATKLDQHYRYKYGLTREDRERLLAEQDGKCKICRQAPTPGRSRSRLHVDHCHTTARVRALLCGNCNTALGLFKEDPEILTAAIAYLAECAVT